MQGYRNVGKKKRKKKKKKEKKMPPEYTKIYKIYRPDDILCITVSLPLPPKHFHKTR